MIASIWVKVAYLFWPPVLRMLEKTGVHKERQNYLVGFLGDKVSIKEVQDYLTEKGFEKAILSWKDPGERLNLRKIDQDVFQYHLRVFNDGEVRGHYEYSSESRPFSHIYEGVFSPKKQYFLDLMELYLSKE